MPKLKEGLLIALEGIDGSGKSTQAKELEEKLQDDEHMRMVFLKEPTNESDYAQKIKAITVNRREIKPEDEFDLFLQDRKWDVETNINPALKDGKVVVMDRYFLSSAAYQGVLDEMPFSSEQIIVENLKIAPFPHITIILDGRPIVGISRISAIRKDKPNSFEQINYLQKVRRRFLELASKYPNIQVVDGTHDKNTVANNIWNIIHPFLSCAQEGELSKIHTVELPRQ